MNRALYNGVRGLVGSLVVFPVAERLEGRDMRSKQRQLAAEMSQPFAERRRRSWNRLVDLVRFSAQKVPYYRDLFATTGFDPESLTRDAKYLADIPYLTKDIIRAEGERLLRDDHMVFRKHVTKSGGSTGPSVHVIYDQEGADWSSAVTRYARAQIGAGASRLQLHLAARFPDRFPARDRMREQMKCLANNRLNVTFASFAPDDLDHIWTRIKAIRPFMVHGHPSTMYQLALHVADRGEGRNAFRVFESSGEMLDDRQRRTVEAVFGCTVIDRYGLAEAGVVAYQTDPKLAGMTVFDPFAWLEIGDVEFGAELPLVPDGRSGEIVITPLRNRMMPLLRYRSGDVATLKETAAGLVLTGMTGRIHDVVEIAGVRVPTHHIQDVLARAGRIREFQIEYRDGRPVFRIVPEAPETANAIRRTLAESWGDAVGVEFIEPGALKLQGWRSKFRHLVTPSAEGGPVGAS